MRLWLDDIRNPQNNTGEWVICRSSVEAIKFVAENELPFQMSLDHDLGENDTAMIFVHWLIEHCIDLDVDLPYYCVHSANPVGVVNLMSLMDAYQKSRRK